MKNAYFFPKLKSDIFVTRILLPIPRLILSSFRDAIVFFLVKRNIHLLRNKSAVKRASLRCSKFSFPANESRRPIKRNLFLADTSVWCSSRFSCRERTSGDVVVREIARLSNIFFYFIVTSLTCYPPLFSAPSSTFFFSFRQPSPILQSCPLRPILFSIRSYRVLVKALQTARFIIFLNR